MLPGLRFAVGAVLASTLLIVMALGLAATVRVAHRQATGSSDTLRALAYDDPVEWGRFFVERRPIATVRADAPAVDGAMPERAPAVMPDTNADAAAVSEEPIASIVTPDPKPAPPVEPSALAAAAAIREARAVRPVAPEPPAAAMVAPAENGAAVVMPETPAEPAAVSDAKAAAAVGPAPDARAAALMPPKASAARGTAPEVEATTSGPCDCEVRKHEGIETVAPVEEAKAVDRVEEVAVSEPPADSADLTTSSVNPTARARSPADAESQGEPFVPALEPSERVIGLPAFPNAGPGFVPRDISLSVPIPRSRPAIKPDKPKRKAIAKRRVRARPLVEPPQATTGYPVPSFDQPWYGD